MIKHFCSPYIDLCNLSGVVANGASWQSLRNQANTISSSEAAAVFRALSKTKTHGWLLAKLRGAATDDMSEATKAIMEQGRVMELPLLREFEALSGGIVVQPRMFSYHNTLLGVEERSTPDGILMRPEGTFAVVEIKWRTGQECAWPGGYSDLGPTVWCQVQHQMRLSNIHRAFVYSGCADGRRRCWAVQYSQDFFECLWLPELRKCLTMPSSCMQSDAVKVFIERYMEDTVTKIALQ